MLPNKSDQVFIHLFSLVKRLKSMLIFFLLKQNSNFVIVFTERITLWYHENKGMIPKFFMVCGPVSTPISLHASIKAVSFSSEHIWYENINFRPQAYSLGNFDKHLTCILMKAPNLRIRTYKFPGFSSTPQIMIPRHEEHGTELILQFWHCQHKTAKCLRNVPGNNENIVLIPIWWHTPYPFHVICVIRVQIWHHKDSERVCLVVAFRQTGYGYTFLSRAPSTSVSGVRFGD